MFPPPHIGQKRGTLTLLSIVRTPTNRIKWLCRCECGREVTIRRLMLISCNAYARAIRAGIQLPPYVHSDPNLPRGAEWWIDHEHHDWLESGSACARCGCPMVEASPSAADA